MPHTDRVFQITTNQTQERVHMNTAQNWESLFSDTDYTMLNMDEQLQQQQSHSSRSPKKRVKSDITAYFNENQLTFEMMEENSGLGQAILYLLRHWHPLTTFLRVPGALLDSSWAERIIKIAIRHRRNSLFYKTTAGALVGDCLMSLIYTAQQNKVDPYEYLNTLQRYGQQVAANPSQWLPWNYQKTLTSLFNQKAA